MSSIIEKLDDEFDYLGENIAMAIERGGAAVYTNPETNENYYVVELPFALPEDKSERAEVFKWLKDSIQATFNGLEDGYELMTAGRDPDDLEEYAGDDEFDEDDEFDDDEDEEDDEEYFYDEKRGQFVSKEILEEERLQEEAAEKDAKRYDDTYDENAPMRIKVVDSTHIQLYL